MAVARGLLSFVLAGTFAWPGTDADGLSAADDGERLAAVQALAGAAPSRARTLLTPMLRDSDPAVRVTAARLLVRRDAPEAIDAATRWLGATPSARSAARPAGVAARPPTSRRRLAKARRARPARWRSPHPRSKPRGARGAPVARLAGRPAGRARRRSPRRAGPRRPCPRRREGCPGGAAAARAARRRRSARAERGRGGPGERSAIAASRPRCCASWPPRPSTGASGPSRRSASWVIPPPSRR